MPAAIRLVGLLEGGLDVRLAQGDARATAGRPRRASPMVSRRTVRWASIRSIGRRRRAACASASATARRSGSRRSSLSSARSIAPEAMSIASCCGSRSYSSSAIANGSAMPLPSARGSPASQRSTVAPASGRPAASRPVTPNRRRIARSWPMVVEARARAPHAPASASACVISRSSGPQSACHATPQVLMAARPELRSTAWRPGTGDAAGGHRSTMLASRFPARKPR